MSVGQARRNNFWFGTIQRSQFIPTPNSGAASSPSSWGSDGTLLSGGGYAFNSWGSHRRYTFEWPNSSAREAAQLVQDYANGSHGRGLIHFQDPLTYDTNILPAQWADPGMSLSGGGSCLVSDPNLRVSVTPNAISPWNLPAERVTFDMSSPNFEAGSRGFRDALFIPVPEGYDLLLSFFGESVNARLAIRPVTSGGGQGPLTVAAPVSSPTPAPQVSFRGGGAPGYWLNIERVSGSVIPSVIVIDGIFARLIRSDKVFDGPELSPEFTSLAMKPWMGGQGNSGCRFIGRPTYIEYSGVNGGQVGYAASLVEVGSWSY